MSDYAIKPLIRRKLDLSVYTRRPVALHLAFNGQRYNGFAQQNNSASEIQSSKTIEDVLIRALLKTGLISDLSDARYSRSARTDSRVSSLNTVVSLFFRSRMNANSDDFIYPWKDLPPPCKIWRPLTHVINASDELPYLSMLNEKLPNDVQVVRWSPVNPCFNARYHCHQRSYQYIFNGTGLDIDGMRVACTNFVGLHNVFHICKTSKDKPQEFYMRRIDNVSIEPLSDTVLDSLYVLKVSAPSFVWHQIRAMFSLLIDIGKGNSRAEIIRDILCDSSPEKRSGIRFASPDPLILTNCAYPANSFNWVESKHIDGALARAKEYGYGEIKRRTVESVIKNRISVTVSDYLWKTL